jgi:hypothetical protein
MTISRLSKELASYVPHAKDPQSGDYVLLTDGLFNVMEYKSGTIYYARSYSDVDSGYESVGSSNYKKMDANAIPATWVDKVRKLEFRVALGGPSSVHWLGSGYGSSLADARQHFLYRMGERLAGSQMSYAARAQRHLAMMAGANEWNNDLLTLHLIGYAR